MSKLDVSIESQSAQDRPAISGAVFFAALLACLCLGGCSAVKRPALRTPEVSIDEMRRAVKDDDAGLFIHCLSGDVLGRYSEYMIRLGWDEIRPGLSSMVSRAEVVEVESFEPQFGDPLAPDDFIWPTEGARAKRVRLALDGREEDFLFVREIDPPPPTAKEAEGFWIGETYYVRRGHGSPETYLVEESPESERTHWRLVFPYFPFQKDGAISRAVMDELSRKRQAQDEREDGGAILPDDGR